MKINDEYFVWAVVLVVVLFAVVYSLNIREHFDETGVSKGGVKPTCPAGTVLSTLKEDLGKCAAGRSDGKAVSDAVCPADTVYNKSYNLCMPVTTTTTTTTTTAKKDQTVQSTPPVCGMNYQYDRKTMKCVGLNDTVTPQSIDPTCPKGTTFNTKFGACVFLGDKTYTELDAPSAVQTQLDVAHPITALASGLLSSGVNESKSVSNSTKTRLYDDPDYVNAGFDDVLPPYSNGSSSAAAAGPGDAYIRKSSLVPCTCTTHSMGCERHAGGKESSKVPGDKDGAFADGKSDQTSAQDQSGLKRPFSKAFQEQGEPTGFLNSFSAFG
jgi:hypothetical protein